MNYKIECIDFLLSEDCIMNRYFPLIPFKEQIINYSKKKVLLTKCDLFNSFNEKEMLLIFKDEELVKLFKRFLVMYDVGPSKLKIIDKLNLSEKERNSYQELFLLPGVKETRARLYYLSGIRSLNDFANKSYEDILNSVKNAISSMELDYICPLPKELRTHIAVAKAIISGGANS